MSLAVSFQILHRGHLNLLNKAASYGNLVVLLNNDSGVFKLKGYLAEPFWKRKRNLLNTGLVNKVFEIYTDPTAMLRILEPDFLIAGNDHTEEEIMQKGGKFAKQIVILPYTEGICSTDLYKRSDK